MNRALLRVTYSKTLYPKREPGENPGRPRHCKRGACFEDATGFYSGKAKTSSDPRVRRPARSNRTLSLRLGG